MYITITGRDGRPFVEFFESEVQVLSVFDSKEIRYLPSGEANKETACNCKPNWSEDEVLVIKGKVMLPRLVKTYRLVGEPSDT